MMMKILILNPHIDAVHDIVKTLEKRGTGLLFASNSEEAWQMLRLHGTSVELAIIHREGGTGYNAEDGLKFVGKVKADSSQADLPIILTSAGWSDSDFAKHQTSPLGVNAYLRWPCKDAALLEVIDTMFAQSEETRSESIDSMKKLPPRPGAVGGPGSPPKMPPSLSSRSIPPIAPPSTIPKNIPATPKGSQPQGPPYDLVLEDASSLIEMDKPNMRDSQIRLEMPNVSRSDLPKLPKAQEQTITTPTALSASDEAPALSLDFEEPGDPAIPKNGEGALVVPENVPSLPPLEIPQKNVGNIAKNEVVEFPAAEGIEKSTDPSPGITLGTSIPPLEMTSLQDSPAPFPNEVTAKRIPQQRAKKETEDEGESQAPIDSQIVDEMPYLFNTKKPGEKEAKPDRALLYAQPIGDAVVPGGAAQTPDAETLKRYLLLREQDVAVLSAQLRAAQQQVTALESGMRQERAKNADLTHKLADTQRKVDDFEKNEAIKIEGFQSEINELKFQLKAKADKGRLLEIQVREATEEMERLKDRVRSDIRKIRVREKELENRLEIMKKDSEALIGARENKIIDLKRKLDLLEFNMDLLQDQFAKERENSTKLREKVAKAAQVVRVAGGLLESSGVPGGSNSEKSAPGEGSLNPSGDAKASLQAS